MLGKAISDHGRLSGGKILDVQCLVQRFERTSDGLGGEDGDGRYLALVGVQPHDVPYLDLAPVSSSTSRAAAASATSPRSTKPPGNVHFP